MNPRYRHGATRANSTQTSSSTASKQSSHSPDRAHVTIGPKQLSIRTTHDPAFVEQLAEYVNETLSQLQQAAPTAPFDKLLMLVSLTLAEEVFDLRGERDAIQARIQERAEVMLALLSNEERTR